MNDRRYVSKVGKVVDERRKSYYRYLGSLASRGMICRAEKGYFPGRAPLGYRNSRRGGEKVIVADLKKAPKIQALFELVTAKRTTLGELCARAAEMGLTSRSDKPLGPTTVLAILNNPFYIGRFRYRGRLYDGRHKALVENQHFEAVLNNLNRF